MYELIIFTMLSPNVKPSWVHFKPTKEVVCIKRMVKFKKAFDNIEGLVFSFNCKEVQNELQIQNNTSGD